MTPRGWLKIGQDKCCSITGQTKTKKEKIQMAKKKGKKSSFKSVRSNKDFVESKAKGGDDGYKQTTKFGGK
jgi:hypothetical protein